MADSSIVIGSEIGRLRRVLVHEPGQEIENMTPAMAAEVLYDDILNLPLAAAEHRQLTGVLRQLSEVYELTDLLADVLKVENVKEDLLRSLTGLYHCDEVFDDLVSMAHGDLSQQLIAGTPSGNDTLEKFLSPLHHALPPLPNAFFTRDAAMCANDRVIIGSMATRVRTAEALLLRSIFQHHDAFQGASFYFDGTSQNGAADLTLEGGDLLMLREDLVVIGYSERTSIAGIDVLARCIASQGRVRDIVVVEIPKTRATIHLDMIFTMVDRDACVVYPPLMVGPSRCRAFHMKFNGQERAKITEHLGLLDVLKKLGLELEPVFCGGDDPIHQQREQWHSGANFFAVAPGHIIGYGRNSATMDALSRAGFEVVDAKQLIDGDLALDETRRTAVAMEGAELSRGGGGCRCMTMPIQRDGVKW